MDQMSLLFYDKNGRKLLRNADEYKKAIMPGLSGGSQKARDEYAQEAYEAAIQRYDSYFTDDSPLRNAGVKLHEISGRIAGMDMEAGTKGITGTRRMLRFDYGAPSSAGTQTVRTMLREAQRIKPDAILLGQDHYAGS